MFTKEELALIAAALERAAGLDVPTQERVEAVQRQNFELWWDTWVAPKLTHLEQRLLKPRKGNKNAKA